VRQFTFTTHIDTGSSVQNMAIGPRVYVVGILLIFHPDPKQPMLSSTTMPDHETA
jgi:hypothetical protein